MRHQPNRGERARPHLRAIARTKTIDAGFLLGVQQPDAKAQLAEQESLSLEAFVDPGVPDLRDLQWISIDERASRELDQISVAEVLADRSTRLRVAIADVDVWVPQGSPLDRHAARNATSVFTGIASYPMLPETLAVGRASLNEGEDRLALVVELIVDPDGTIQSGAPYRAVVRNQARLDYDEAGAWLADETATLPAGSFSPEVGEQLRLHEAAVLAMRDRRLTDGALDLVRAEVRPIFDNDRIVDLVVVPPNRARTLIEHLMVGVNAAIARFMSSSALPWIARSQGPRDWHGLLELAAANDYALPDKPDRAAFGRFVQHLRTSDPQSFSQLQPAIARLLGGTDDLVIQPGEDPPPHYGLALNGYTRATAPIRRYADLLALRLLKAAIANQPAPYSVPELDDLIEHYRERGRAADAVERDMLKLYGIVLVEGRTSEVFEATVTTANDYGVWARLDHPPVEGRLVRATAELVRGDRIRVRVAKTNWERGFVDLTLVL